MITLTDINPFNPDRPEELVVNFSDSGFCCESIVVGRYVAEIQTASLVFNWRPVDTLSTTDLKQLTTALKKASQVLFESPHIQRLEIWQPEGGLDASTVYLACGFEAEVTMRQGHYDAQQNKYVDIRAYGQLKK
jgi:hypothetical protein